MAARDILCRRFLDTCLETASASERNAQIPRQPYNGALLLRLLFDHAQTADGSRDRLVDALFDRIDIQDGPAAPLTASQRAAVDTFADELVDGLLLPLKAVGTRYADGITTDADADVMTPACIFPPSPMTVDDGGELSPAGQTAAQLLSMLDGTAVTMLQTLRGDAGPENTVVLPAAQVNDLVQFAVLDQDAQQGPAANTRLLALQRSIARILHETGAGAHIDAILQDTGAEDLLSDGTTSHLGRLMQLRLDGWWDGRGRQGGSSSWWIEHGQFAAEDSDGGEGSYE